ncbi:doublecortin domain-containing protein 2 isoform X2 [Xyrichtys novacula]|nr:doublecortin domain-containing protein 2 isoform X2 [Xyrichtys novacula]
METLPGIKSSRAKTKCLISERHDKEDGFAHTGFREDLEHTARGHMEKHTAKPARTKQQRQVSRTLVLSQQGRAACSIHETKESETEGAEEVPEDRRLKVDLPIDWVEAKTVDEEDESCCASPCKASLRDSDALCLQRSLSAGSRKDHSFSARQGEPVKGTGHRAGAGDRGLKTPAPEEAKERKLCPVLRTLRSRRSRLFKVCDPHGSH